MVFILAYGSEQLVPPLNCENLARRLEDANENMPGSLVNSFERDSNGIFEVPNSGLDHSLDQIPPEEKELITLGDLESESIFSDRIGSRRKR